MSRVKRFWRKRKLLLAVVRGRWDFRSADRCGLGVLVLAGSTSVTNRGRLEIGRRSRFMAGDGRIIVDVGPAGAVTSGERLNINFGTEIRASGSITFGDRVSIGPRCLIGDAATAGVPVENDTAPIEIGDDVWIATRTIVLPGARIGAGSVITSGSVVDGEVPPGVVAGGVPLRVIRAVDAAADAPADTAAEPAPTASTAPVDEPVRTESVDDRPALTVRLVSDFTIDPLAHWLERERGAHRLATDVAPFGAPIPALLAGPSGADVIVAWTQPAAVLPAVAAAVAGTPVDREQIEADVDTYVSQLESVAEAKAVLVPTWTLPDWERGRGVSDLTPGGVRYAVDVANLRLLDKVGSHTTITALDSRAWLAHGGSDRRSWLRGKVPFTDAVFEAAAADIAAAIATRLETPRKLLVLDLDDTMWGGIVGDDGWEQLRLGGHDPVGEAFVEFQRAVRRLRENGVLLALASKNEESVALEAIESHPEMVLKKDDFATWRINWHDKAANIADLTQSLNLGLQSVVFLDDNPRERARVREALPEVLVPEWPVDPMDYLPALESLRCFDLWRLTDEDRARAAMYADEAKRTAMRTEVADLDSWLADLDIVVDVAPLAPANLTRAAQLLNKTNQLNLRTRRLTDEDFAAWADEPGHETLCITVSDRLGTSGLTGILSLRHDDGVTSIEDYVLSCRVMGRQIEPTLLYLAAERAKAAGSGTVRAEFIETAKNAPTRRVLDESEFDREGDVYQVGAGVLEKPSAVTVQGVES